MSARTRYLAHALLLAIVVTAACARPAHAWAGRPGLAALGLAAGVCLLGAGLAHLAARAFRRLSPGPESGPQAVQVGFLVRMLATLALSLPVILLEPVSVLPFAVWLGVHYLAQLGLEVFVSLKELGQNHGPTGTPARASQPEAGTPPTGSLEASGEDAEGTGNR